MILTSFLSSPVDSRFRDTGLFEVISMGLPWEPLVVKKKHEEKNVRMLVWSFSNLRFRIMCFLLLLPFALEIHMRRNLLRARIVLCVLILEIEFFIRSLERACLR